MIFKYFLQYYFNLNNSKTAKINNLVTSSLNTQKHSFVPTHGLAQTRLLLHSISFKFDTFYTSKIKRINDHIFDAMILLSSAALRLKKTLSKECLLATIIKGETSYIHIYSRKQLENIIPRNLKLKISHLLHEE